MKFFLSELLWLCLFSVPLVVTVTKLGFPWNTQTHGYEIELVVNAWIFSLLLELTGFYFFVLKVASIVQDLYDKAIYSIPSMIPWR